MAIVHLDTLQGVGGERTIKDGQVITRKAIVEKLNGLGGTGGIVEEAIAAVVTFTGPEGSPCTGILTPTFLERFQPKILDQTTVEVTVIYKGFPAVQIEFSSSLSAVESNEDKDGNIITVGYTYPADYAPAGTPLAWRNNKYFAQGGMVTRQVPETVLTIKYLVGAFLAQSATQVVWNFIQNYAGCVNREAWTLMPGDPRTWLVESIRANSRDGGVTYELAVSYHYRKENWDAMVAYINPDDGKPPPGPAQTGGAGQAPSQTTVRIYPEVSLPGQVPTQPSVTPIA